MPGGTLLRGSVSQLICEVLSYILLPYIGWRNLRGVPYRQNWIDWIINQT